MHRPIANLWATYAERVLPTNASKEQVIETKRAFYAGAHSLFEKMGQVVSEKSEKEGIAFCSAVENDAEMFVQEIKEGKV